MGSGLFSTSGQHALPLVYFALVMGMYCIDVASSLPSASRFDENVKASKNITVKSIRQTVSEVVAFAQAAAKNLLTPKALAFA